MNRYLGPALLLVFSWVTAGCTASPPEDVGDDTRGDAGASSTGEVCDTTMTTDAETTAATTDAMTAGTTTGGEEDALVMACGLATPCPTVFAQCDEYGCTDREYVGVYPEAQLCVFEQLAAGAEFQFVFDRSNLVGEEVWIDVAALATGQSVRQEAYEDVEDNFAWVYSDPERCSLQAPEWFQGCIDAPADDPMFTTCLDVFEWFLDDCVPATSCP